MKPFSTRLALARSVRLAPLAVFLSAVCTLPAQAQRGIHAPVTPQHRATAQQVAQAGVPLSALAPDAPNEYTVRRGDTLWGISGKFLRSPWRWPELWGMNLNDIRNPHLIYPGQQLYLERVGDRAFLRARKSVDGQSGPTVRVSPRNRAEALDANPLPTLESHLIEPFLAEPMVFDEESQFTDAPRIVALRDHDRVLVSKGDRAYARGPEGAPLLLEDGLPTEFRVFRAATPLIDPVDKTVLGYEGQFVGRASLVRGESESEEIIRRGRTTTSAQPLSGELMEQPTRMDDTQARYLPIPATVDIVSSKEEMRPGDRLLPEPAPEYQNYAPHAPAVEVDARVVSVYGSAVRFAGGNQVVAINKGSVDGVEPGQVLSLQSTGSRMIDKTSAVRRESMQLPDERNGLGLVFRSFERVAYVLVMEVTQPVQVGDKLINPR